MEGHLFEELNLSEPEEILEPQPDELVPSDEIGEPICEIRLPIPTGNIEVNAIETIRVRCTSDPPPAEGVWATGYLASHGIFSGPLESRNGEWTNAQYRAPSETGSVLIEVRFLYRGALVCNAHAPIEIIPRRSTGPLP